MSTTRTIQRSPDLGLGIRLQRLVPTPLAAAALPSPQPPYWWDGRGGRSTVGEVSDEGSWENPEEAAMYVPDLWAAVVENATDVTWKISYTPVIHFDIDSGNELEIGTHTADPILFQLPPEGALPSAGYESSRDAVAVDYSYPYNGSTQDARVTASLPRIWAVGNTLIVLIASDVLTGVLVATAFVGNKALGRVKLTIKYVTNTAI